MTLTHSEATDIIKEAVTTLQNGSFMEQSKEARKLLANATNLQSELGSIYKPLTADREQEVIAFQQEVSRVIEFYKSGRAKEMRNTMHMLEHLKNEELAVTYSKLLL